MDEHTLVIYVASFTKSGGSWLVWMLVDLLTDPDGYCDLMEKDKLDRIVYKTEQPMHSTNYDLQIIRHPLDICCSSWNYLKLTDRANITQHDYYDSFIDSGGKIFQLERDSWKNFMAHAEPRTNITIRYEDLLDDTEGTLRKIVSKSNPARILDRIPVVVEKYSVENCKNLEGTVKFKRPTNKKYTFFNKADKYYYDEILTPEQIRRGHEVFGEYIEKYWPESIKQTQT